MNDDLISRQTAINALWKALHEYEDKTEKQFQESEDLDVGDWIVHRGFVQNMSDIDRQTILNLPSADVVPVVRCKDCKHWERDVIFQDGWCRGRHQPNPNWFCADGERRTDDDRNG